jgi:hypothetical protein
LNKECGVVAREKEKSLELQEDEKENGEREDGVDVSAGVRRTRPVVSANSNYP